MFIYTVACPSGITLCQGLFWPSSHPPPWGFQSIKLLKVNVNIRTVPAPPNLNMCARGYADRPSVSFHFH